MAEEGLAGQSNKAGATVTPDVWNDFANPNEGTSFVAHGHLGARAYGRATLGLHYFHAWSQDDRGQQRRRRHAGIERQPARREAGHRTPPTCA